MKAVLISIQPKWCELIASGKKTVEVRKTKPKLETPFKVYIYCTQGKPTLGRCLVDNSLKATPETDFDNYNKNTLFRANGKVIGEFVCDSIKGGYFIHPFSDYIQKETCLSYDEIESYSKEKPLFAWNISDLVIYDKPKELSEFYTIDNEAIKKCEHRERVYNNPNYTNGAWLLGSYICNKDEPNWCEKCKTKPLTKPPQSWCYVEELVGDNNA